MNRSKLLLVVSIIAFLLSQVYLWVEMPRLETAPPRAKVKKNSPSQETGQLNNSVEGRLRVDLLTRETAAFSGVKRDLFTGTAVVARPPVKVVPPPKVEVAIGPPVVSMPVVEPPDVAPEIEVVKTQLAKFTFLGYLKKNHQQSVFLAENGEIFVVQQGERFGADDQFEVKSIDVDKMTILETHSGGLISVSLVEQAPLMPNRSLRSRSQVVPGTPRNQTSERRGDSDIEQPVRGRRSNMPPESRAGSEVPPHIFPDMPPGTEMPPSWQHPSRGIPHE